MLTSIAKGIRPSLRDPAALNTDVAILPRLEKDNSDRNRTSPFAYTGNKFEFRMLGSSQSIAFINTVLSAALADVFSRFAQRLEECSDLETEVAHIVADTIQNHGRILFNGNNYSQEWVEEATRRGLPILNTVEALDALQNPKNIQLFCRTGVLSETECHARHEIFLENYVKVVGVEAETMLYMAQQQILPACVRYMKLLSDSLNSLEQAGVKNETLKQRLTALSEQVELLVQRCDDLLAACHKDRKADLRKRGRRHADGSARPDGAAAGKLRHPGDHGGGGVLAHAHLHRSAPPNFNNPISGRILKSGRLFFATGDIV
jgi:glutamine synthetase